jgi:hypothetical protein
MIRTGNSYLEKAHTCVSYHIQAFQRQASNNEVADLIEPCKHCLYNRECDLRWYHYIMSAIPETKYRFTLAQGLEYQTEGTDHQNDFCEMDN